MPLNPPSYNGLDVYYSPNVFVNKVPVALWQPPSGLFNNGAPGTAVVAGITVFSTTASGNQAMYLDLKKDQGPGAESDDTDDGSPTSAGAMVAPPDALPPGGGDATPGIDNPLTPNPNPSAPAQPGDVELTIDNLPNSFGDIATDPIYRKRISKYFLLADIKQTIEPSNGLSARQVAANFINLCVAILDPIKAEFNFTIRSAFRSPSYNASLPNASKTSDHLYGKAADITCGDPTADKKLFNWILNANLPFRQMIWEKRNSSWVHISYNNGQPKPDGTRVCYTLTGTAPYTQCGQNGENVPAFLKG